MLALDFEWRLQAVINEHTLNLVTVVTYGDRRDVSHSCVFARDNEAVLAGKYKACCGRVLMAGDINFKSIILTYIYLKIRL